MSQPNSSVPVGRARLSLHGSASINAAMKRIDADKIGNEATNMLHDLVKRVKAGRISQQDLVYELLCLGSNFETARFRERESALIIAASHAAITADTSYLFTMTEEGGPEDSISLRQTSEGLRDPRRLSSGLLAPAHGAGDWPRPPMGLPTISGHPASAASR